MQDLIDNSLKVQNAAVEHKHTLCAPVETLPTSTQSLILHCCTRMSRHVHPRFIISHCSIHTEYFPSSSKCFSQSVIFYYVGDVMRPSISYCVILAW